MPEKNDPSSKITSQSRMIVRSYLRDGALLYIFAALFLALLLPQIASSYLKSIDYLLSDFRTNQVHKGQRVSSIVIVDIDERSLREQGAWPWSREKVANLIRILLDEYKAASIVMDMTFPEKRGGEVEFKAQISRPQVVGGAVFSFKQTSETQVPILKNTPSFRLDPQLPITKGSLSITNHPELPFAHVGHINRLTDSDGSIRAVAPFICDARTQSFCLPTLSLAAYASQLNQPTFSMRKGEGGLAPFWVLDIYDRFDGANQVLVNSVPLDEVGNLMVPYRHKKKDHWITNLSATDVLQLSADRRLLEGNMVFIGGTALSLADLVVTPFGTESPGFLPHIEILSALLDGEFSVQPKMANLIVCLLLMPFMLLCIWAQHSFQLPIQRFILLPAWALLTFIATISIALWLFGRYHFVLPLLPLLLFPIFSLLFGLSYQIYRIGSDKINIMKLFGAYLPKQEANRLTKESKRSIDANVDASKREITVLFADVNGFAKICEESSPETVAKLMHKVFTVMSEVIVRHNGTIDKFIGDAIMAFWNAPHDDAQHAQHALNAAIAMQAEIATLDSFCIDHGISPIEIGIGIETGIALVGNFGSEHRRTYTAMGEPVVLASRIEGITRALQHNILIGEQCAHKIDHIQLRSLGDVQVRGRTRPIQVYAPR